MFSKKNSKNGFNYTYKQSQSAREKQKNRLSFSRISSLKSAKLALPIVFVLFFGSLGIYKLMSSKAATIINGNIAIGDNEYDSTNGMLAGSDFNSFGGSYISRDGQISIEQKTYNFDENGNQTGQYTGDLTLIISYRDRSEKKEVLINGSNYVYSTHGQMSWSYDSKNLVFIAQSKTLGERLIVASGDGSGYEVYAKTGEEGVDSLNSVGWTRDGQILYVENGKNFCRKSLDNYSPKCVEINLPLDENNSIQPSLLGQLEVTQDDNTVFAAGWSSIYKFNMDGSDATKAAKLSDNTLSMYSIAISPDGKKLAVFADSTGKGHSLYVLPVSELTSKRTLNITNDFLLRPALEEVPHGSMLAWFAYERPKGWSSWESLGGNFVDSPTVASWGSGRLDVFARGTKNDMVHKWYAGGYGWLGWESLGGDITSSPSAVSWGKDRIDIFARGKNGDVVHKWYAGGYGWLGWESLGGGIIGAPSVISTGSGKLDVFVRGTNSILHRKNFDGKKWSGWQNLGVTIDAQPVALKKQNSIFVYVNNDEGRVITIIGRLDTPDSWSKTDNKYPMEEGRAGAPSFITSVSYDNLPVVHEFRRSTHGRLYYRPPTTYKDEMFADGEITSSPAGVSWGGTRLDVFARGKNGDLLHLFKQ